MQVAQLPVRNQLVGGHQRRIRTGHSSRDNSVTIIIAGTLCTMLQDWKRKSGETHRSLRSRSLEPGASSDSARVYNICVDTGHLGRGGVVGRTRRECRNKRKGRRHRVVLRDSLCATYSRCRGRSRCSRGHDAVARRSKYMC